MDQNGLKKKKTEKRLGETVFAHTDPQAGKPTEYKTCAIKGSWVDDKTEHNGDKKNPCRFEKEFVFFIGSDHEKITPGSECRGLELTNDHKGQEQKAFYAFWQTAKEKQF